MKIMYLIHSLTMGGAETIAVNYLIELKKRNVNVFLVQMEDKHTYLNERLEQAKVQVITISTEKPGNVIGKVLAVSRLKKVVRQTAPDLIHVHTGMEKFKYLKFPPQKTVFTFHSSWERSLKQGENHKKMLFKYIKEKMKVIVLTEAAKKELLSTLGTADVHVVPNGFDIESIKKEKCDLKQKEDFLKELGIEGNPLLAGHVGRFHPVKNHKKIIDVFEELYLKNNNYHLILVGGGAVEEEDRVRNYAKESSASPNIHFTGTRTDARTIISMLDIFIMPSLSESFPLSMIEAQILSVPCLVSDTIPPETCVRSDCIQLPLQASDKVWADTAINLVLRAREGKTSEKGSIPEKNSENKSQEGIQQFSIDSVIDKTMEIYKSVCKSNSAGV